MNRIGTGVLLATAALVSACGSSTKTVIAPGPNGLPYARAGLNADFNTMTNTYKGVQFKAKASDAISVGTTSFTNSRSVQSQDVNVTILDATRIQVTTPHLGTKVLYYDAANSTATTAVFDNVSGSGTGPITGTFGLASASTSLKSIFFGYINETANGANFSDTFIVSGFETDPSQVSALSIASASYSGPARMTATKTDNATVTNQVDLLDSAAGGAGMNLNVNFSANSNQVTGTISGATDSAIGGGTMTLTLAPATITGNEFSTTFTSGQTGNSSTINLSNSQLTGVFYGANAKEVGGTLSARVDVSSTAFPEQTNASGFFVGNR